jgi:hypothetical protein
VSPCYDFARAECPPAIRAAQEMALVPTIGTNKCTVVFTNRGSFVNARRAGAVGTVGGAQSYPFQ